MRVCARCTLQLQQPSAMQSTQMPPMHEGIDTLYSCFPVWSSTLRLGRQMKHGMETMPSGPVESEKFIVCMSGGKLQQQHGVRGYANGRSILRIDGPRASLVPVQISWVKERLFAQQRRQRKDDSSSEYMF